MVTIKRITDLSETTIKAIAEVYAGAFGPRTFYVSAATMAGMDPGAAEALHSLRMKKATYQALAIYELYAAYVDGDERIGAVVILKYPKELGGPTEVPTPYDAEIEARMPPDVKERDDEIEKHVDAVKARAYADRGAKNYNLSWLGTARWAQGRGLGSALVNMILERGRKDGRNVMLTTHTVENAEFYKRRHFNVYATDEWMIGDTQFRWWAMCTDFAGEGVKGTAENGVVEHKESRESEPAQVVVKA